MNSLGHSPTRLRNLRIVMRRLGFRLRVVRLSVGEAHRVRVVIPDVVWYFFYIVELILLLLLDEDLHLSLLLGSPELIAVSVVFVHYVELSLQLQV